MAFDLSTSPFSSSSPWNATVPTDANYTKLNWPGSTGYNYDVHWESYSTALYQASSSDPLVQVSVPASWGWPGGTVSVHIPAGATGNSGTDGAIVAIDGNTAYNFWQFNRTSNTTATASAYGEANVATGTGWGTKSPFQSAGITAAGTSELGGLLVQSQTNTGTINHALELVVDSTLVKPGAVGAAIASDGGSSSGIVQEGQRLAIPKGTPMPSGLSPLGQEVFTALQNYGAYVDDVGGGATGILAQTNGYSAATIAALNQDTEKMLPMLQAVSGGSASSSGSGSSGSGTTGSGSTASGSTGSDPSGSGSTVLGSTGSGSSASGSTGSGSTGLGSSASGSTGSDPSGPGSTVLGSTGSGSTGSGSSASGSTGSDPSGSGSSVLGSTGSDPSGSGSSVLGSTGPGTTGSGSSASGSTGSDPSGSGSSVLGSTGSDPSGSGSSVLGSTGSGTTGSGSSASGSTGSDPSGSGSTVLGSTGSGSTGSDSSASGSTGSDPSGSGSSVLGSTGSDSSGSGTSGTSGSGTSGSDAGGSHSHLHGSGWSGSGAGGSHSHHSHLHGSGSHGSHGSDWHPAGLTVASSIGQGQANLPNMANNPTTLGYTANGATSVGTNDGIAAKIALFNQYTAANFATPADFSGGAITHEPPASAAAALAKPHSA